MVYLEGTREECNAYLKKLALSKGTAHCFLDDKVVPELSAMDNIIMVTESINKGNILRAVKRVGLRVNTPAKELSFSDQRKIVLLRALFSEYDTLLLEEPLDGIEDHIEEVKEFLEALTLDRKVYIFTSEQLEINRTDSLAL